MQSLMCGSSMHLSWPGALTVPLPLGAARSFPGSLRRGSGLGLAWPGFRWPLMRWLPFSEVEDFPGDSRERQMPGPREPGKQQSSLRSLHKERMSRAGKVRSKHPTVTHSAHSSVTLGRGWLRDPRVPWGTGLPSKSRAGACKTTHPPGRPQPPPPHRTIPSAPPAPTVHRPLAEHRCAVAAEACIRPISRATQNSPMCCLKYPAVLSHAACALLLAGLLPPGPGKSGGRRTSPGFSSPRRSLERPRGQQPSSRLPDTGWSPGCPLASGRASWRLPRWLPGRRPQSCSLSRKEGRCWSPTPNSTLSSSGCTLAPWALAL